MFWEIAAVGHLTTPVLFGYKDSLSLKTACVCILYKVINRLFKNNRLLFSFIIEKIYSLLMEKSFLV